MLKRSSIISAAFLFCSLFPVPCSLTYADSGAAASRVEAERITRDREAVLNKLKIIVEENAKLKDEITALQIGIVNLDNLRKAGEDEKRALQDKLAALRREFEPIKKLKEEAGSRKSEAKKYEDKVKQLEGEIREFEKKELNVKKAKDESRKELEKKEREFEKEKQGLEKKLKAADAKAKEAVDRFAGANKASERLKREAAIMHYNLGVIFQSDTKFANAIREYEKALEARPDDAPAHYNLALIYDTVNNDRQKAVLHYRKYLDIEPDADDAAKVKERLTALGAEQGVWGDPGAKGISEKKGRW